jgi:hypothetical protein
MEKLDSFIGCRFGRRSRFNSLFLLMMNYLDVHVPQATSVHVIRDRNRINRVTIRIHKGPAPLPTYHVSKKKRKKKQSGISCRLLLGSGCVGGVKRRDAESMGPKTNKSGWARHLCEDSCANGENEAAEGDLVDAGCASRLGSAGAGRCSGRRGRLGCRRARAGSGRGGVTTGHGDNRCGGHDGSRGGDSGSD